MRLPLLLVGLLAAGCHDPHGPHPEADHGHDHGPAVVPTVSVVGEPARLWSSLNHLADGLPALVAEGRLAAVASDAANLAALALALEPKVVAPDRDRAQGMLANLARAADHLLHAADEGALEPTRAAHARLAQVLALARTLDPASAAPGAEPVRLNGPSGGRLVELRDAAGTRVAWAEVKLHGDAGDLELRLAKDARISEPFAVPVAAVAKLDVIRPARSIELRAQDAVANKDERGRATVSEGRTHYLVYPGATGADTAWLTGETFSSPAKLTVEGLTAEFELRPH